MDNMGNYKAKKEAAEEHNTTKEVVDNLFPMGVCSCGSNLFMYLNSSDENIYNIYCDNPGGCGISDIRDPVDGDRYFWSPQDIVDELAKRYGSERIAATFEQPPSKLVDNAKNDSAFESDVNLRSEEQDGSNPKEEPEAIGCSSNELEHP
jgi:hypothetical protein